MSNFFISTQAGKVADVTHNSIPGKSLYEVRKELVSTFRRMRIAGKPAGMFFLQFVFEDNSNNCSMVIVAAPFPSLMLPNLSIPGQTAYLTVFFSSSAIPFPRIPLTRLRLSQHVPSHILGLFPNIPLFANSWPMRETVAALRCCLILGRILQNQRRS